MSDNKTLAYDLPQDAYVNFDAVSLKSFIIDRLNENSTFTDQNYEGSNLSFLIEILAYYTHVLLFYLNQNSSESLFDQATIYENMSRIVKLIGYKPTGQQTSILPINCTASSNLAVGDYLLKKYSYFLADNIQFTVLEDFPFEKTTAASEIIDSINKNLILYQGTVHEYPNYTAEGIEFESFPIVVENLVASDSKFIADGTISVYVKEVNTNTWVEYTEVDNLYLTTSTAKSYELRLNENGHYEVKFGNNVFGKKLDANDVVKVMYLLSDGLKGVISKNVINGNKLYNYTSSEFDQIYVDTASSSSQIVTTTIGNSLTFSNSLNSTAIYDAETVDQIRANVPFFISAQNRLVTTQDYEKYISKSLPNIVNSVKVVDNNAFISEYINYFYRICVDPNKANRVLINQVNFADTCDFNNINVFCVPKFDIQLDAQYPTYISETFKNMIIDITKDKKMVTNEVIPRDPIYNAFDIGFSNSNTSLNITNQTKLVVVKERNNKISNNTIKSRVVGVILDFFKSSKNQLGQTLNLSDLTSTILSVEGVASIRTENTVEGIFFNGVSFIAWNPIYPDLDNEIVNQTITLPFYKFPYFYSPQSLINKIDIVDG